MSDADLKAVFDTECERIHAGIIAGMMPPNPDTMDAAALVMHHHAAIRVLAELLSDLIGMTQDAEMRDALRIGVVGVLSPGNDVPNSKELH